MICPHCQSEKTQKSGWKYTVGKRTQRYKCLNCGKTFSDEEDFQLL